jgi:hypothetical protein
MKCNTTTTTSSNRGFFLKSSLRLFGWRRSGGGGGSIFKIFNAINEGSLADLYRWIISNIEDIKNDFIF